MATNASACRCVAMADSRMTSWRRIGWVVLTAVAVVAVIGVISIWLALDKVPRVLPTPAVATADIERAHGLFKRHDPQRQRPGIVRLLAVEQSDVDLVLNHAARRWTGLAARAELQQGRATLAASVPVPHTGRWANIEATLTQSQGLPEVSGLRIGKLALPAWCAGPVLGWVLERGGVGLDPQLARDVVRHVDLRPGRLFVFYAWREDTNSRMLTSMVPAEDQARLKAYSDRLVELVAGEPVGAAISLSQLLPPLFAQARQRTAAGADPALENRAVILTLTFYANHQGLALIVPAARHWQRPTPRVVTLAGRSDTPLHYLVSAALAAESGSPLADAVGLYKEVRDAQGGSGFSFNDLAADRAGTRLGERAIREALRLQEQLAQGVTESDLLPNVSDLPEALSAAQFQARFGSVGSAAYRQLLADIDARLNETPLLR